VLDVFAGSAIELHIEIKTDADGRRYPGLEQRLVDVIADRRQQESAILTCFMPRALEIVREIAPRQRGAGLDQPALGRGAGEPGAALDRLLAIDGCLIAVEKGLLADRFDDCLARIGADRLGAWVTNEPDDLAFWLARPIRQITHRSARPRPAGAQRLAELHSD
jgi:glycerophosphoryl diester phosphodiesterase